MHRPIPNVKARIRIALTVWSNCFHLRLQCRNVFVIKSMSYTIFAFMLWPTDIL